MSVTSHRAGAAPRAPYRLLLPLLPLLAVVAFVTLSMVRIAVSGLPMSVVDEHIHLDTAYEVHAGSYPHRGSLMSDAIVQEWACGVGHEAGGPAVPCGDPSLGADSLPSGRYTTGYIHYPTYFWGGEAFRWLVLPHGGDHGLVDAYRAWSAVLIGLGLLACAGMGLAAGLRGSALWAATLLPVAASGTFLMGTLVNPASTALLCGALVAATGLAWMRRGRGFGWFAAATGLASVVAVTDVLPVGAFLLAVVVVRLGPRVGLRVPQTRWQPRWWQFAVLCALVLAPVVAWGRVIAARATVDNEALYGVFPSFGLRGLLGGIAEELFHLHTPWYEAERLLGRDSGPVVLVLRQPSLGIPDLVTVVVLGLLAACVVGLVRRRSPLDEGAEPDSEPGPDGRVEHLLAACTLVTLVLYPVALRISNTATFGFDYGIVNRYSIPFAPLLTLLVLLLVPGRLTSRVLATLAVVCVAGLCAVAY